MQEQWMQWKPFANLEPKYYCVAVSDTFEGFKVVLVGQSEEKEMLEIYFKDGVLAYTQTDESFKRTLINDLDQRYGTDFYGEWTLFKVQNSKYVNKILEESYGWASAYNLIHFSLITEDLIIDILNDSEPAVSLVKVKTP